MTEPNQCPRCGSYVRNRRYAKCTDPWHTPAPQPAAPCSIFEWCQRPKGHEGPCLQSPEDSAISRTPASAPTPVREEGAALTEVEKFWKQQFPNMVDEAGVCEFAEAFSAHQNAALRQEVERLTNTFLVCETIQPDGSLRATLKDVIRRAETAEAELRAVDEAFARRPALVDVKTRWEKAYKACEMASSADKLGRELESLRKERDALLLDLLLNVNELEKDYEQYAMLPYTEGWNAAVHTVQGVVERAEISAAEAMEKDGLYDMEPSEDLVDRIMQRLEGRLKT
jgi:hypothetical protein